MGYQNGKSFYKISRGPFADPTTAFNHSANQTIRIWWVVTARDKERNRGQHRQDYFVFLKNILHEYLFPG